MDDEEFREELLEKLDGIARAVRWLAAAQTVAAGRQGGDDVPLHPSILFDDIGCALDEMTDKGYH